MLLFPSYRRYWGPGEARRTGAVARCCLHEDTGVQPKAPWARHRQRRRDQIWALAGRRLGTGRSSAQDLHRPLSNRPHSICPCAALTARQTHLALLQTATCARLDQPPRGARPHGRRRKSCNWRKRRWASWEPPRVKGATWEGLAPLLAVLGARDELPGKLASFQQRRARPKDATNSSSGGQRGGARTPSPLS